MIEASKWWVPRRTTAAAVILTLAAVVVAVAPPVAAWNDVGHRLISRLAWDHLDPVTRAEIATTLRQHPRFDQDFAAWMPRRDRSQPARADAWLFQTASTWPDIVRRIDAAERDIYHHPTWHFINEPLLLDDDARAAFKEGVPGNRDRTWSPSAGDRLNILQALQRTVAQLSDPHTPPAAAAVEWCWLLHLVGDLHQPLHTTALFTVARFPRGDRGGNEIPIAAATDDADPLNLHTVWDRLLDDGDRASDREWQLLGRQRLRRIGEAAASEVGFGVWLAESHELARTTVYTPAIRRAAARAEASGQRLQPLALTDDDLAHAREIARARAAQAGYRLATLIEQIARARRAAD